MFSVDFVVIILFDKAIGTLFESFDCFVVPPLVQVAMLVVFATLIIKCVCQLKMKGKKQQQIKPKRKTVSFGRKKKLSYIPSSDLMSHDNAHATEI